MEASIYSRENELRAIELFIKYDFGPKSVINELGYPCRASLCNWCNEYLADGNDIPDANPYQHYGEGLKRAVVDHYFKHGKCLARTCRALHLGAAHERHIGHAELLQLQQPRQRQRHNMGELQDELHVHEDQHGWNGGVSDGGAKRRQATIDLPSR